MLSSDICINNNKIRACERARAREGDDEIVQHKSALYCIYTLDDLFEKQ